MRSLQSKLMLWIGLAIATILAVAGLMIYFAVYHALLNQFDAALDRTVHTLAYLVETDGERIQSDMAGGEPPQFVANEKPDYYQIFRDGGGVVESSSSLKGGSLPMMRLRGKGPVFEFLTLPDGRAGRVVAIKVVPRFDSHEEDDDEEDQNDSSIDRGFDEDPVGFEMSQSSNSPTPSPVTLVFARDMEELNDTLAQIWWLIAIVTIVAIMFGLGIAAWVARLGLRPLRNAVGRISSIDGMHLDIRLDPTNAPSEVQPTIVALNQMLDRLKDTFLREREFSANVAHELRTPLAGIKSTIEVAVSRKRESDEYQAAFGDCLAICDDTEAIIDNLFTLSRIDAGKCMVRRESVDLTWLMRECWKPFEEIARQNGLSVSWSLDESVRLPVDPEKLRLVLRNLFDNAVSYSSNRSSVEIRCRQMERTKTNRVQFQITNTSSRLQQRDVPYLFERFWRADKSRSQTGRHSGLGLPLCRSLIRLLGGNIDASLDGARFRISVELPAE